MKPAQAAGMCVGWVALGMLGCVGVLGLDDYGAIEDQLCVCDALDGVGAQRCRERVGSALQEDSAATQAWLEHFDEKGCGTSCESALACFDQAPVCTPPGNGCAVSAECCGSSAQGSQVGCCTDPDGAGTCCASCVSCAEAARSVSPRAVCADENENSLPLAKCACGFASRGLCEDACQSACDPTIKLSKSCFDCLSADDLNNCGLLIDQCRGDQP